MFLLACCLVSPTIVYGPGAAYVSGLRAHAVSSAYGNTITPAQPSFIVAGMSLSEASGPLGQFCFFRSKGESRPGVQNTTQVACHGEARFRDRLGREMASN